MTGAIAILLIYLLMISIGLMFMGAARIED